MRARDLSLFSLNEAFSAYGIDFGIRYEVVEGLESVVSVVLRGMLRALFWLDDFVGLGSLAGLSPRHRRHGYIVRRGIAEMFKIELGLDFWRRFEYLGVRQSQP